MLLAVVIASLILCAKISVQLMEPIPLENLRYISPINVNWNVNIAARVLNVEVNYDRFQPWVVNEDLRSRNASTWKWKGPLSVNSNRILKNWSKCKTLLVPEHSANGHRVNYKLLETRRLAFAVDISLEEVSMMTSADSCLSKLNAFDDAFADRIAWLSYHARSHIGSFHHKSYISSLLRNYVLLKPSDDARKCHDRGQNYVLTSRRLTHVGYFSSAITSNDVDARLQDCSISILTTNTRMGFGVSVYSIPC